MSEITKDRARSVLLEAFDVKPDHTHLSLVCNPITQHSVWSSAVDALDREGLLREDWNEWRRGSSGEVVHLRACTSAERELVEAVVRQAVAMVLNELERGKE